MSENIAQDPRTNRQIDNNPQTGAYRVPNAAQQPRNYTETPLSEAAGVHFAANEEQAKEEGGYFPDHIPGHVVADPDNAAAREVIPGHQKKPNWVRWGGAGLIAAIGIGGTAYGVGYLKTKGEYDAINDLHNSEPSVSAPINSAATAEQVVERSDVLSPETVQAISEFDSKRHLMLDKILGLFAQDNFTMDNYHMYEGRTIELASEDMSPTAILDRNAAKNTFLTTNPDHQQALAQIDIAARPGTRAYQNFADRINSINAGTAPISADEDILIQSKYFEDGTFYDTSGNAVVSASDTPTQVISAMSQRERTNTVFTFQWDKDQTGTTGDWRLITAAEKPDDLGYVDPLRVNEVTVQ